MTPDRFEGFLAGIAFSVGIALGIHAVRVGERSWQSDDAQPGEAVAWALIALAAFINGGNLLFDWW